MERITIQITERQARLIELLIQRSDENSPMNDTEFSSAQMVLSAIRKARYDALPKDAPAMREP